MTITMNVIKKSARYGSISIRGHFRCFKTESNDVNETEFRVFDVRGDVKQKNVEIQKYVKPPPPPPRSKIMPVDQDWSNVWPGPRSFHPATVPLPVKQGFDGKDNRPPPGKYANAELMKLPNFLHLTPPAIKKHCKALQKFCTPWPKPLYDDSIADEHFPLQVTTTDYCHSSPKIRDPKARVVGFKLKLSKITLDKHAKDKMLRLLGERYNSETDVVTIVSDRCPMRKQNYDYNQYLLMALFHESWKRENWEAEKTEEDMEYYDWDRNPSKKAYIALKTWPNEPTSDDIVEDENLLEYKEAVSNLFNRGETIQNLFKYKEAVLKILF